MEESQEFIEVADNYGLPARRVSRTLLGNSQKLGVSGIDDDVIPSIRSIDED